MTLETKNIDSDQQNYKKAHDMQMVETTDERVETRD